MLDYSVCFLSHSCVSEALAQTHFQVTRLFFFARGNKAQFPSPAKDLRTSRSFTHWLQKRTVLALVARLLRTQMAVLPLFNIESVIR